MITSSSNGQIKELSALIKKARERRSRSLFVVEGPKMVEEAPRSLLQKVYYSELFCRRKGADELLGRLRTEGISAEEVSERVFCTVSDTQSPQGILAVVKIPSYSLTGLLETKDPMFLLLESIQDPGNLGTMIRTGEGAGVTGVIANRTTVDLFNPKTIRSTMGSIYRVPFLVTEDFPGMLGKLRNSGVKLYGAHLRGEKSYEEMDYRGPCGFLIGNEGNGLSDETANACSGLLRIPMEGKVESLNAAVSAAVLMYEAVRQRRVN